MRISDWSSDVCSSDLKRAQVEDKERGYSERSYGRFERRIGLPQGIDRDKAAATFKKGVLTVTLPRSEAANGNVRRRTEERSVGKGGVRKGRSRRSRPH